MNKNLLIIICISLLLLTTILSSIIRKPIITENFQIPENNICNSIPANFNIDRCLKEVEDIFKSKKSSPSNNLEYNQSRRKCYRQEACKTDNIFVNYTANTNDYTNFKGIPLNIILDPKYIWRGKDGKKYINDPKIPFKITIKDKKGKNIEVKKNIKMKDITPYKDRIKEIIKGFRPLYCDKIPGDNRSVADKIIYELSAIPSKEGARIPHPLRTGKQYPRCSTKKLKDIELPEDAIKIIASYIYEIEIAQ